MKPEDERRLRTLKVSSGLIFGILIQNLFHGKPRQEPNATIEFRILKDAEQRGSLSELPDDLAFHGCYFNYEQNIFVIGAWSQSFDPVPPGEIPPEIVIVQTVRIHSHDASADHEGSSHE